jgi:predicted ATP-grasp superfamily ATP-dependent carboligase
VGASLNRNAGRILITEGENRSVLAAARGLASAGYQVTATAPSHRAAAFLSHAVAERITLPDPLPDPGAFMSGLERIVSTDRFDMLMPGTDMSLLDVSRNRVRLAPHVQIGLPPHAVVERALDKRELIAAAARHGLTSPRTTLCASTSEAIEAAAAMGYPLMVKPPCSVIEGGSSRIRRSATVVSNDGEMEAATRRLGVVLVQERLDGHPVSFAGVFADGRLLAEAVSRYHRTWPPDAGSVCYSLTIDGGPELRRRVIGLLDDLGWEGVFELELLEDLHRADVWQAIDLNPRPYGSLAVAIEAGANIPAVWCDHVLGQSGPSVIAAPDVYYRWTDADVRYGLWHLRHGEPSAAAPVLRLRRGVVHPYARASDPGPAVARALDVGLSEVLPKLRNRRRRAPAERAIVIGAGPNGLAVSAHLQGFGVPVRCFGDPLRSWSERMPAGMLLRSRRRSSSISAPDAGLRVEDFERTEGRTLRPVNLSLKEFLDYGEWFQRHAVPEVERREVSLVESDGDGFAVQLADGERLKASTVIVATGIASFIHRPIPFSSLSRDVCSHAYDHADLGAFAGQRLEVIGSGQSALECAALLHESDADVEVLSRAARIKWLGDGSEEHLPVPDRAGRFPMLEPPPTDIGGVRTGWLIATPDVFRRLPRRRQSEMAHEAIGPAGSGWLRPRLREVPIRTAVRVLDATESDGKVVLSLSDGSRRSVDHVLLGTGYQVDIRRSRLLSPELVSRIELAGSGYPVLTKGLEASVPGLHFMGAAASYSFGPINRFVVGTWYSAPAVARRVAGRPQPPISFAF